MKVAKMLVIALCETVMLVCIGLFIFGMLFRVTIGDSKFMKSTITESGLYATTTNSFRGQLQNTNNISDSNSPIITNAINKSIKEDTVKNFIESSVSQTYLWLEGKTQTPKFSLDTNQIKIDLAEAIASGLSERAANLPACNARLKPTTDDLFAINCIPPGTDVNTEISKIKQQILATDTNQLGQNTPISAESITFGNTKQPYYQNLAQLPTYYQLLKNSVFIFTAIFLLMAIVVIILKRPRYKALKALTLPFMIYGVLYVITGYIAPKQLGETVDSFVKSINPPEFINPLKHILTSVIKQGSEALIKTGVVFIIIGLTCMVVYILVKRKNNSTSNPPNPQNTPQPNL